MTSKVYNENCPIMDDQILINDIEFNQLPKVSPEVFEDYLCLYPQNELIIEDCRYFDGRLFAKLINKDITYSIARPNYFTAEQIVLAISQMGYLLAGEIIKDQSYTLVDSLFYEPCLKKIINLNCYFTDLKIQFRKKILKRNDNIIEMCACKIKYLPLKEKLFTELVVNIGSDCNAKVKFIIV